MISFLKKQEEFGNRFIDSIGSISSVNLIILLLYIKTQLQ
jgi:hypothetical protein